MLGIDLGYQRTTEEAPKMFYKVVDMAEQD